MEEKKNVHCKFTYKCGICGQEYNNILDRAKCEIACAEKAEAKAKKAAELKKKEEQKVRKAEVDAEFKKLPNTVVYGTDINGVIAGEVKQALNLQSNERPIFIIADTFKIIFY